MTIWPKNLFQAKILTQKFITSYKIDPKIYFSAKKVPSKMAHPVSQSMEVTPPPPPEAETLSTDFKMRSSQTNNTPSGFWRQSKVDFDASYSIKQEQLGFTTGCDKVCSLVLDLVRLSLNAFCLFCLLFMPVFMCFQRDHFGTCSLSGHSASRFGARTNQNFTHHCLDQAFASTIVFSHFADLPWCKGSNSTKIIMSPV